MATISFNEKVVVTDPQIAKIMIDDLEDTAPSCYKIEENLTMEKIEESSKNWVKKLIDKGDLKIISIADALKDIEPFTFNEKSYIIVTESK